VERFFKSGVLELRRSSDRSCGNSPPQGFRCDDFAAFLALLPQSLERAAIRHAVEVRHESFVTPDFIALLREHAVAPVLVDSTSIR